MDEETSTKAALLSTISRLKRQVALERQPYVKEKIQSNAEKIKQCVRQQLDVTTSRRNKSKPGEMNMLSMRIQKAFNKFGGDDEEGGNGQDDSSAPIVVGSTSGSKSVVKPVRLPVAPKIPPYTTWIFLDRNQRMAEDQSVVGRRRIYYDNTGNEALICSDSEDEQLEDEEEKREFTKGDDFVISVCVREYGPTKIVWKTLAEVLQAKTNEVEARFKSLTKESDAANLEYEKFQDLTTAMDSFDNLFCRRCLVFDCRLHGCSQSLVVPCEKQPPSTKQGPTVSCGPTCFHLPRLSGEGVSSAPPAETEAPKDNIHRNIENADARPKPGGYKVGKLVPEVPKRVFIDKGVNALRKLLKRKTSRPAEEDPRSAKKQRSETSAEVPKAEQQASKAFWAKKLLKMKMSAQITRAKRYNAGSTKAKEEDDKAQLLEKQVASKWNAYEKALYETGLQMFGRDSCTIARNLLKDQKTCAEVGEFMRLDRWRPSEETSLQLDSTLDVGLDGSRRLYGRRRGKVRKLKYTWKSVGPSLRKRLDGKEGCKQYTPCSCTTTCGKQCTCTRNGTCCEKYCGCSKNCKNRFRGCHCAKSQCSSRQCPCFAAGRECDPDVCRNCCVGCGDGTLGVPPSQGESYLCRNMKLLLKQQQRVLLGKSDVAGWGAFLKSPVNKHDYLGEYTGELISHHEADKRGKIYDRENSSFLFNLNDQYVLDACRRGDKLKFANHSPNPNCYAKVIMVAGDHRVGIFANERISAGDELFYDYRYEADRAPPWAKKPEDNNKNDDSATGSRRAQKTA